MPQRRHDHEKREHLLLAPYAQSAATSLGRTHAEEMHDSRTEYQRDRDRIIHSRAFRRLEYKSQVFLNNVGDHYRTRLTHTIEVASAARSIARALRLNEDLTEAIALAHDLGHPPFGHPGEHTLMRLMQEHGGFEHNRQSLRIVQELELKYPGFNGLNLTVEVCQALNKSTPRQATTTNQPLLEAQVSDVADEITYICHDLDDAIESQLLDPVALDEQPLWQRLFQPTQKKYPRMAPERLHSYVIRCLLNFLIEDVITTSAQTLQEIQPTSPHQARSHPTRIITQSPDIAAEKKELKAFLNTHFYLHPAVALANQNACRRLEELFHFFNHRPHLMSEQFLHRQKKDGVPRSVCDYLAGMTDRSALQQHAQHFSPTTIQQSPLL
jgi:dGTPase